MVPDDVEAISVPALTHRLILGPAARVREVDSRQIIQEILATVPAPGGELGG